MSLAEPAFAIPLVALTAAGVMWISGFDQRSDLILVCRRLLQAGAAGALTYHMAAMVDRGITRSWSFSARLIWVTLLL